MDNIKLQGELNRFNYYLCTKPVLYGNIDYIPVDKEKDNIEDLVLNYLNDKTKLIRLPKGTPIDKVISENFSLLEVKAESEFSIESPKTNRELTGQQGPITAILNVIRQMDPATEYTSGDIPRVDIIEQRIGQNITAEERDQAYKLYQEELEKQGGNGNEE